jgi:hypothetical protein
MWETDIRTHTVWQVNLWLCIFYKLLEGRQEDNGFEQNGAY